MVAMVGNPGIAQNLAAETALEFLVRAVVLGIRAVLVAAVLKGVRCRSEPHDRATRIDVVDNVLHLFVGQFPEAGENQHQVGRIERIETGNVGLVLGIDFAGLGVDREQHRAVEAVMRRQHLRHHGQRFFRAVFLVAADQYDVFAQARALTFL